MARRGSGMNGRVSHTVQVFVKEPGAWDLFAGGIEGYGAYIYIYTGLGYQDGTWDLYRGYLVLGFES